MPLILGLVLSVLVIAVGLWYAHVYDWSRRAFLVALLATVVGVAGIGVFVSAAVTTRDRTYQRSCEAQGGHVVKLSNDILCLSSDNRLLGHES